MILVLRQYLLSITPHHVATKEQTDETTMGADADFNRECFDVLRAEVAEGFDEVFFGRD